TAAAAYRREPWRCPVCRRSDCPRLSRQASRPSKDRGPISNTRQTTVAEKPRQLQLAASRDRLTGVHRSCSPIRISDGRTGPRASPQAESTTKRTPSSRTVKGNSDFNCNGRWTEERQKIFFFDIASRSSD